MRRILSAETVDKLVQNPSLISYNGGLWGYGAARGTNITMSFAGAEVTSVSDTAIVYTVSVDILDPEDDFAVTGLETHDFVYEKTADGWRWSTLYIYN